MQQRPWHRHYDYNVPTSVRIPNLTIHDLLGIPANAYPDKAAVNFYGTEITFWELRGLSIQFANALASIGVTKEERVGIHLPNCPQYLIAYYAVLSLGAVVVNLNPMYTAEELKMIAKVTGMTTLITFDMVLPTIHNLYEEVRFPRLIVTQIADFINGMGVSTHKGLGLREEWYHFSALMEGQSRTRRPRVEVPPDAPALIQFTGGTTGTPKGAVLTHRNVVAGTIQSTVWGSTTYMIPFERRSVVAMLPYFHAYGNIVVLNWAIFNCATQIQMPRFEIDEMMNLLANFEEVTFFPTVPTVINALVNHPKAVELNLAKRIKLLNSGAAPMPLELIEQIKDLGIFFSEGYGLTESTSLGISNPILGLKKVGSIGIPYPDNDVRLVDVQEGVHEVPVGEPGEIVMKGPLIMQGYWENPQETAEQLRDGWLHTGDIAVQDEDGYFFIVDRKKDMIIAGGYNIYPREIEEVLYEHPKVKEAVAAGVPDPYRGETVKAYIVLKEGATATEEEIIEFCRERLARFKVPRLVEFRQELPKSMVGKVLRRVLVEEERQKAQGR